MKIKVISVGKPKEKSWRLADAEYTKRIERYALIEHIVVKDARLETLRNEDKVRQTEADYIVSKIKPDEFVVALDRQAKQMSSEVFAEFLSSKMLYGINRITFVVGGPLGLSGNVLKQANLVLSFSQMTLPHELAKVVLLEQIYRAFSIIKGEQYHK